MSAASGPPEGDRLDSWKEIASHLGREVRTVQGWEKTEGLQVHRHQHRRQGSVYAFKSELDAWREARKGVPDPPAPAPAELNEAEPSSTEEPPHGRRTWIAAGSIAVALVAAGFFFWNHRGAPAGDPPSSVVVLPFLDFSPQKDQEYFSDGLTEELIDALTRVPNLRVVARTSSFAFKGKPADVREIGKQLNVTEVLEGSVRKSGDQLRITAQLARVSDGYHWWSHTYDRPLRDVFALQRELAQTIADQLRAGVIPERDQTRDLEAYRLYQEGRFFFNKFEPPDSDQKAIERYQQALQRDPRYAKAYAGMAEAYAYLAENFVVAPREVMPKARDAAEKAVALDDSSAEAHTSIGIVKLDFDRDVEGGQREFLRARQLNPGSADARHWYAHSLEAQGKLDEAMKEMRAALDLDPLSIPISWDIASELNCAKRYDDAIAHLKTAIELFPNIPTFTFVLQEAYSAKGDQAASHKLIESLKSAQPDWNKDPFLISMVASEEAEEGHSALALHLLDHMDQMRKTQYVEPMLALIITGALRDNARSQTWLKRADEERSTMVVYLPMMKDLLHLDAAMLASLRALH